MEFECITFIVVKYQKEDVLIWIYINGLRNIPILK